VFSGVPTENGTLATNGSANLPLRAINETETARKSTPFSSACCSKALQVLLLPKSRMKMKKLFETIIKAANKKIDDARYCAPASSKQLYHPSKLGWESKAKEKHANALQRTTVQPVRSNEKFVHFKSVHDYFHGCFFKSA
jgi:hypothetical protein